MWKYAECIGETKPEEIDERSSEQYVYIRKNITEKKVYDEEENEIGIRYEYEENTVKKKDWELYKSIFETEKTVEKHERNLIELIEITVNHEYALTFLELGITEVN